MDSWVTHALQVANLTQPRDKVSVPLCLGSALRMRDGVSVESDSIRCSAEIIVSPIKHVVNFLHPFHTHEARPAPRFGRGQARYLDI